MQQDNLRGQTNSGTANAHLQCALQLLLAWQPSSLHDAPPCTPRCATGQGQAQPRVDASPFPSVETKRACRHGQLRGEGCVHQQERRII